MVLMEIVGGFVMVISIFTMYYVYLLQQFRFATTTSIWAQLFAVVGGAWFIYDGPAIIQKHWELMLDYQQLVLCNGHGC